MLPIKLEILKCTCWLRGPTYLSLCKSSITYQTWDSEMHLFSAKIPQPNICGNLCETIIGIFLIPVLWWSQPALLSDQFMQTHVMFVWKTFFTQSKRLRWLTNVPLRVVGTLFWVTVSQLFCRVTAIIFLQEGCKCSIACASPWCSTIWTWSTDWHAQ